MYLKHVTENRTDGIYQLMRRLSQLLKACLVSFLRKKKEVLCLMSTHIPHSACFRDRLSKKPTFQAVLSNRAIIKIESL